MADYEIRPDIQILKIGAPVCHAGQGSFIARFGGDALGIFVKKDSAHGMDLIRLGGLVPWYRGRRFYFTRLKTM